MSLDHLLFHRSLLHPVDDRFDVAMEQHFLFAGSGLGYAVVVLAVFWMVYRAYQVLSKPADELTNLLGLELPAAPTFALAAVKSDAIILHWKPADAKLSTSKHRLHINGICVGDLSPAEPILAVTGLKPNTGYVVRVRALSQANFEVASDPIRIQTKSAAANDFFHDHIDEYDTQSDLEDRYTPAIEPYKSVVESATAPPTATAMAREHSGSVSQKRSHAIRRHYPATGSEQPKDSSVDVPEGGGMLSSLTGQLDKLRDEADRVAKQIDDEDDDFQSTNEKLSKSRDSLRRAVNEKESASRNLRSQVAKLEREERSASNRRVVLEKQLQHKRDERERLKLDMLKWDNEIGGLRAEAEELNNRKFVYRDEVEERINRLREQHASILDAYQAIEESIKLKKTEIKQLEDEKQQRSLDESALGSQFFAPEEDHLWHQRLNDLQFQYNDAWQALEYAKRQYFEAQGMLQYWEHRRQMEPHMFTPSQSVEAVPIRRNSQRRTRAPSLRNELSPQVPTFEAGPGGHSAAISTTSPSYPPVSSFFNMANGTVVAPINPMSHLSRSEIDQLTAGAPTSPSAGDFLPSDLLSDDLEPPKDSIIQNSPLDTNMLPGLGAPQALEHANQGPSSPGSTQSRSPSVFASPRESQTSLTYYSAGDGFIDSDRRSIRSNTGSGRAISITGNNATSRFTSLFGFSRQRGKTFSEEGPALGSLKRAESQSFPRQDMSEHELGAGRRRGSHGGGSWMDMLYRGTSTGADPGGPPTTRKRFNMFGSKTDSWPPSMGDRPPSPGPGSTTSSEVNLLPRPSTETQSRFGWPISGEGTGARHIGSPLAPDWGLTATNSWSRHPSRRPSIQYGSSLSLGLDAPISEADHGGHLRSGSDFDLLPGNDSSKQAPIGTRPKSSASQGPKLNPAAPSFKTLFSRDKKSDENEKPPKEKKEKEKKEKKAKDRSKDKSPAPEITVETSKETPATDARKSKDGQSLSTAGDTGSEPRDSLDRAISRTPSEAAAPGSAAKESFMQRLSRKSSSSILPFTSRGKDGKGSVRFSKKGKNAAEHGTPDETDEEGATMTTSKSFDSVGAVITTACGGASPLVGATERQSIDEKKRGFSFRSLTGRAGRKEKTPSLHESLASETGDEMEESFHEDLQ